MGKASQDYPADFGKLVEIRGWVARHCRDAWCLDEQSAQAEPALHDILLAVQEAATNIIRHGFKNQPDQRFRILLDADSERVRVTFEHFGLAFDPSSVAPPEFDGSRTGGFGVYLIEQLVDEVSYTCEEESGCRKIELLKYRQKPNDSDKT